MRQGFGESRDNRFGGRPQHAAGMADFRRRRQAPVEKTGAEEFYFVKQMNSRTPMVVVLEGGEALRGVIEWYDQACIKVNRTDAPNMVVYKHSIRCLYKDPEGAPES